MNDNIMHEWLVATVKAEMKLTTTTREKKILAAVAVARAFFCKANPKKAEIIRLLYFDEEWMSSKAAASMAAATQGMVNKVKREFLQEIHKNLREIEGDEKV